MPPESWPARRQRNWLMPEAASKRAARALRASRVGYFEQIGIEADVLVDGQILIKPEPLRHVAEMLLAALGVRDHIDAVDDDAAAVWLHHARQHAHRRGLAGAVGPDQAENLAAIDGETQAVHGGELRQTAWSTPRRR